MDLTACQIAEHRSQAYWALSRFFLTRPDERLVTEIRDWTGTGADGDLGD